MTLLPDQHLFEYKIIRLLGQGAFGSVYLAHDTLLDRPVAIKELTLAAKADPDAMQRFLQEARAAGGLNHRSIVAIYALRTLESDYYLAMEYVDGGSLRSAMETHGRLGTDEAASIAADVCDALAVTHARGIVHRDIKPENVLLTRDKRAKVSDFGIAHVPAEVGSLVRTQSGFQPGTFLYMSPEQVRGKMVDDRSDVYQAGVLLYEMLAGKHPIDAESVMKAARKSAGQNVMLLQARFFELLGQSVCEATPSDIEDVRPGVPDYLARVVKAAMAKQGELRPSAGEVASALRQRKSVETIERVALDEQSVHDLKKHLERGAMYRDQLKLHESVQELQAAKQMAPSSAEAHYSLGLTYEQLGRLDDAIREFQSARRIRPGYVDAYCGAGKVYYMQGRLADAINELQNALGIDANRAQAHATLGMIYGFQGNTDSAICEYVTALAICPDNAEWHYMLSNLYLERGHREATLHELQLSARLGFEPAQSILGQFGHKR